MKTFQLLLFAVFAACLLLSVSEARSKRRSRPDSEPITLEINCDDENCCVDVVTPDAVETPLSPPLTRRARIVDVLRAVVIRNGSAYNFSTVEEDQSLQLMSLAGLANNDNCTWKVSVNEKSLTNRRSLSSRVKTGQTIAFSYETVEEIDEEEFEEDSSKLSKKTKSRKGGRSNSNGDRSKYSKGRGKKEEELTTM